MEWTGHIEGGSMSHMKRTQIYHARDHKIIRKIQSVAWRSLSTKKVQGSTFSIGVDLLRLTVAREDDAGSTSPLFKLTGNYTWRFKMNMKLRFRCFRARHEHADSEISERRRTSDLKRAPVTATDYWRRQWCWGWGCSRFCCRRRHANSVPEGIEPRQKLLVNQPAGGGS